MKITTKMIGIEAKKNPADFLPRMSSLENSDEVSKGIAYAERRYKETGRHYFVTNEGHSALDTPSNRKVYTNEGLKIVYTTKRKPKSNPARKPAARNPAPEKRIKTRRIVRVDPKTGQEIGTEWVPIDFDFRAYVGGIQFDFFARTEGAQLIVSERTTGAKVGAVPYTTRVAALNDREAAKQYLSTVIDKVGPDRFKAAVAKAPKIAK